jgi:uncharacterized protein (DUF934 family)
MAALIKRRRVVTESAPSPDGKVLRLEPTDDPASVVDQLAGAARVEVNFPKFGDGRGFSIGRLLRERHGYKGELRAVGHITRDHLFFMESVGFDAFELREGEDPHEALAAFNDFSESYQASPARPQPLFRRRAEMNRLEARLREIAARYAPVSLASSLQAEDMVITDAIARLKLPIGVFALDTGRLHEDTLSLIPAIRDRYGLEVEIYEPRAAAVVDYVYFYGRAPAQVLRDPQSRTACASARRETRVDYRPTARAGGKPRAAGGAGVRRRARHREIQSARRLVGSRSLGIHPCAASALQPAL